MIGFNPLYAATLLAMSGPQPTLDMGFTSGYLRPDVTYASSTNKTMFDSQGRLVWAPANLMRNSGNPTGAGWGVARSSVALVPGVSSPVDAVYSLTEDTTATNSHAITQTLLSAFVLGASYTLSGYFKADSRQFVGLLLPTGAFAGAAPQYFDLVTGAIGASASGFSAGISNAGGGWWRCWVTGTCTTAATGACIVYLSTGLTGGDNVYTGDGVSDILMSACQVERTGVDSPKSYVQSLATEYYGPRIEYDPVTLTVRGLLTEEARTNLVAFSRDYSVINWSKTDVTVSAGPSINGDNSGSEITEGSSGTSLMHTGMAITANTILTGSFVAKSAGASPVTWVRVLLADTTGANGAKCWFNVATGALGGITLVGLGASATSAVFPLGNGYYRIVVTCIVDTTSTTGRLHINSAVANSSDARQANATYYLDHAQGEHAPRVSSIIPTSGATATRNAETNTVPTAGWYAESGTFVVEFVPSTDSVNNRRLFLVAQAAGYTDVNGLLYSSLRKAQNITNAAGGASDFGASTVTTGTDFTVNKAAMMFDGANCRNVLNGGAVTVDAARTIPTPGLAVKMWINGYSTGVNNSMNGWIRRIRFFPKFNFTDAELQALTA